MAKKIDENALRPEKTPGSAPETCPRKEDLKASFGDEQAKTEALAGKKPGSAPETRPRKEDLRASFGDEQAKTEAFAGKTKHIKKKLLLLGGGGHCRSVLDCALASGEYDEIGIIDSADCEPYEGVGVVGCDDDLPRLFEEGWNYAFITVGSVGNTRVRRRLFGLISQIGFRIPVIMDPTAVRASGSTVKEGTFIGKRAVVNAGCHVGRCAILNTGCILEHDCSVGDFAHISPGTVLCGHVTVGDDSHVGAASVVRQEITIGEKTLIGAGSVVVKDLPDGIKAFGNPCREI